ncbi:MAG TPA: tetratricopeptide repeat protein [Thermoanaerobaculia bacterium]|nr:tetratricopeptide repeat protein [Thermoanaerobaculia bacterium]
MKWAALALSATLALAEPFALPFGLHLPLWAERILWNPRERTERALAELKGPDPSGKPVANDPAGEKARKAAAAKALPAAETALRLAPDDPTVQYDAGTVQLLAGKHREAVKALDRAARDAPGSLAADAQFNLGTGKLAAGDAAGAVAALEQALRLEPSHAAAKHNLELALIEREKERLRTKKPQDGSRGDRRGDRESGPKNGGDEPGKPQPNQNPQTQGTPPQPQPGQDGRPQPGPRPQNPGAGNDALDRFREQPDMNAREAAAILRSVERLERQQRRAEAEKRARAGAAQDVDWQDW